MIGRLKFQLNVLVKEILDRLPPHVWSDPEAVFLDPSIGGGQFVREIIRRLRVNGFSDEDIQKRVYGFAENKMALVYVQRRYELIGQYNVGTIEALESLTMKFDVIVGNPPFQDSTHGSKGSNLWQQFLTVAFQLVKDDGHVALVTPNQWLGNGKQLFEKYFQKFNPLFINNEECSKWFPKVGSYFSYYIIQKSPNMGKTLIRSRFKTSAVTEHEYDLRPRKFLPMDISPLSVSIVDKVLTTESTLGAHVDSSFTIAANKIKKGEVERFSAEQTPVHQHRIYHTPSQTFWSNVPHRTDGQTKVLISTSSSYRKMSVETEGFSQTNICILVPPGVSGDDMIHTLTLNVFTYINDICRYGNWNQPNVIKMFPAVDFTRKWTNEELYAHFNLTEDEIQLIEDTIS